MRGCSLRRGSINPSRSRLADPERIAGLVSPEPTRLFESLRLTLVAFDTVCCMNLCNSNFGGLIFRMKRTTGSATACKVTHNAQRSMSLYRIYMEYLPRYSKWSRSGVIQCPCRWSSTEKCDCAGVEVKYRPRWTRTHRRLVTDSRTHGPTTCSWTKQSRRSQATRSLTATCHVTERLSKCVLDHSIHWESRELKVLFGDVRCPAHCFHCYDTRHYTRKRQHARSWSSKKSRTSMRWTVLFGHLAISFNVFSYFIISCTFNHAGTNSEVLLVRCDAITIGCCPSVGVIWMKWSLFSWLAPFADHYYCMNVIV